jgi:hypothetical protein
MEHSELHQQKIQILGRLIKESSLTLEEALLLLQEKEEEVVVNTPQPFQGFPHQGTNPYYGSTFTVPLTGTINSFSNGTYNMTNTTTSLTQKVLGELEKAIEDANL